jgi:hypothetical protein
MSSPTLRTASRMTMATLASLALLCGTNGCHRVYPFELRGGVRSAADGSPLAEVTVMLRVGGIVGGTPSPVVTGADGTFNVSFRVADIEFMRDKLPRWSLVLSKEGYDNLTIDVSPTQEPKSSRTTTISVDVKLRPR